MSWSPAVRGRRLGPRLFDLLTQRLIRTWSPRPTRRWDTLVRESSPFLQLEECGNIPIWWGMAFKLRIVYPHKSPPCVADVVRGHNEAANEMYHQCVDAGEEAVARGGHPDPTEIAEVRNQSGGKRC